MTKMSLRRFASKALATSALTLLLPVAAHAQSWAAGISPLSDVPAGSATQAIADMYFGQSNSLQSPPLGQIRLTPSYVKRIGPSTSVFYNADTGNHGTINYIGGGQTLILEQGPDWGSKDSVVPSSSLTLMNTAPYGNTTWTKILE